MITQEKLYSMSALRRTVEFILIEKRLPGRLTENPIIQSFGYLKVWLKNQFKSVNLENVTFVYIPHIGHRYLYQVLHLLSLAYPNIVLLWDFNLKNYINLGYEGRRLFSIKNLKILSRASSELPKSAIVVCPEQGFHLVNKWKIRLHIFIEADVSKPPTEASFVIPYGVHPSLLQSYDWFNQEIPKLRSKTRSIPIFFSGTVSFVKDPHLVERYYGIPSRLRCVDFLIEHSKQLNIRIIRNAKDRRKLASRPEDYKEFSLVLGLCKGLPEKWLTELSNADFFLALPGGYMPMCHNVIEAMAVGTIPILSYEDYFSPALVHGKNCLTYRHLEELPDLIKFVKQMDLTAVGTMRKAIIDYYNCYLNPSKIAQFIRHYQGSTLRLYINHEDAESLRQVTDTSILRQGGSLQYLIDEQAF